MVDKDRVAPSLAMDFPPLPPCCASPASSRKLPHEDNALPPTTNATPPRRNPSAPREAHAKRQLAVVAERLTILLAWSAVVSPPTYSSMQRAPREKTQVSSRRGLPTKLSGDGAYVHAQICTQWSTVSTYRAKLLDTLYDPPLPCTVVSPCGQKAEWERGEHHVAHPPPPLPGGSVNVRVSQQPPAHQI